MNRGRLEAFSDGVIAILVTIMVLDLRPPGGTSLSDLHPMLPKLLVYVLSFVFLGIYWVNHHHLMQLVERIDGRVLWANMLLLFSLSLTPIATSWLGPHLGVTGPTLAYGFVLLASALSYWVLTLALLAIHGPESRLGLALRDNRKEKASVMAYVIGIVLAPIAPWASLGFYVAVAIVWLVPDRRIERVAAATAEEDAGGES
jgi:uncharacterized membrane protein